MQFTILLSLAALAAPSLAIDANANLNAALSAVRLRQVQEQMAMNRLQMLMHRPNPFVHPSVPEQARPKIYLEVVRINQRVVVDEKNHKKSAMANVNKSLYAMRSGKMQRIFMSNVLMVPKDQASLGGVRAMDSKHPGEEAPGAERGEPLRWLYEFFARLKLKSAASQLLAAVFIGFVATMVIYAVGYTAMWLFRVSTGYGAVSDASGEILLSKEEQRKYDFATKTASVAKV